MNIELQINLTKLFWFGKTPSQVFKMLQKVFGDNTMSCTCIFEWNKIFKKRCKEVKDHSRNGRPSAKSYEINVTQVRQLVYGNHQLTVLMIACLLYLKKDQIWKIITGEKGMSEKVCWASTSSWLRGTSLYLKNLPIHLISLYVTFFFSPSSKESSQGPILKAWKLSRGP